MSIFIEPPFSCSSTEWIWNRPEIRPSGPTKIRRQRTELLSMLTKNQGVARDPEGEIGRTGIRVSLFLPLGVILSSLHARLIEELRVAHGDGSYIKFLKSTAKSSLIVLDDWGLTALSTQDRADLLEILDDRINTGATLIASQLPVDTWHAYLGEPTLADAILDRLVHQSHRIELKIPGQSMRDNRDRSKQ